MRRCWRGVGKPLDGERGVARVGFAHSEVKIDLPEVGGGALKREDRVGRGGVAVFAGGGD